MLLAETERYRGIVFHGVPKPVTAQRVPTACCAESAVQCPDTMARLLEAVLRPVGIDPSVYRVEPLMRRLTACLRALRVADVPEAIVQVSSSEAHRRRAASALLIGVTGFFRDPPVWTELRSIVLPMLLEKRPVLDAWSVACSDGAELYSLAMLLLENPQWKPGVLLGTDCRPTATERALAGEYAEIVTHDLPRTMRMKYFLPRHSGMLEVAPFVRALARWSVEDAIGGATTGPWDLILCRNLAIYLQMAASRRLWHRLYEALRPGGVLVVGKAERPEGVPLRRIGSCLFQKDL